jgi:hypothetical protein
MVREGTKISQQTRTVSLSQCRQNSKKEGLMHKSGSFLPRRCDPLLTKPAPFAILGAEHDENTEERQTIYPSN